MYFALLSMVNLRYPKINFRIESLSVIENTFYCTIVSVNANGRSLSIATDNSLILWPI